MANKEDKLAPDADVGEKHYKQTFKTSKRLEKMEEAATEAPEENETSGDNEERDAAAAKSAGKGSVNIKQLEEQSVEGHWKTARLQKGSKVNARVGRRQIGLLRHGSAYAFLVGLIVMGIWFSAVFAPNIILVNIKEMFTNDLADATIALWTYDHKMLDYKLGKADCGNKDTIKCKLTTMSRDQVKAFEKAGFTVNGEKVTEDNLDDDDPSNDKEESRYKVTSIQFPHNGGTASSADQFDENANKSSAMKALTFSVFNPKSSFFMDARYKQRIKWRYDLTKTPTVSGDTEKAVDSSFNSSMEGGSGSGEDAEKMDDSGGGNYSLKGLAGDVGKNGLKSTSEKVAGLSYNYVDNQCAYFTQAKVTYNAMIKAKHVSVARFAMQYLKAADQIKAGLSDEMPANILSSKLAASSKGNFNGANATDYSMYKHIVFGDKAQNESIYRYNVSTYDAFGKLIVPWLTTVYITQQAVKGIAHISSGSLGAPGTDVNSGDSARKYCLEGQKDSNKATNKEPSDCPALVIAGTPVAMQAAVAGYAAASGGGPIACPHPPRGAWVMEPTSIPTVKTVMPYIKDSFADVAKDWASDSAKNFTADLQGKSAAEAIFAGTGEILGDMAMSRGMRPGTKQTMQEYLSQGTAIEQQLEEVGRYNARNRPFDLTDQYSFMGSVVRSFASTYSEKTPVLSTLGSIFSLIPTSVKQLDPSAQAFYHIQPRTFDSSRLGICNDTGYQAIGIEADILCNVRYSMSTTELNADPKTVLDYMLKSHSDFTQSSVSELQNRLNETDNGNDTKDKEDVRRQYNEMNDASGKAEIDEKTGAAIPHSEYEKFLTYCVNRENPWGTTSLATRYKELSDSDKEDRNKYVYNDIHVNGYKGDPNELSIDTSYMAVVEGASADQDWYTGKKCLEESEELHNFRAYTMMCSVDGSHSGAIDCTEKDDARHYFDGFYNNNDIIYTSYW
jgi:hypothetical protein